MVNKFVYVECHKQIKRVVYCDTFGNMIITKARQEMCGMINGVEVDNIHNGQAIISHIWLYHPHASVLIWFLFNDRVPVYESTRVSDTTVFDRKKCQDTHDIKATHVLEMWAHIDKSAIVPGQARPCCQEWVAHMCS